MHNHAYANSNIGIWILQWHSFVNDSYGLSIHFSSYPSSQYLALLPVMVFTRKPENNMDLALRNIKIGQTSLEGADEGGCEEFLLAIGLFLLPMIFIMGKKVIKCPKQCTRHAFQLKPVHYSAVFSRELTASYCPCSAQAVLAAPAFNTDRRHFTPAFRLPSDRRKPCADEEFYQREQTRCRAGSERSEMFLAKPRGTDGYCSVCKEDYEDYLQHINEETHRDSLRENKFNGFIDELAAQVDRQAREDGLEARLHRLSSETILTLPFSQQESTCFDHQDFMNPNEGQRIHQFFHSTRNFHLLKGESIELQEEGSLFRRPSFHERQTETIMALGVVMSPVKPVLSVIISQAHHMN